MEDERAGWHADRGMSSVTRPHLRSLVVPVTIVVLAAGYGYGCAPHVEPLEPETPEVKPEPPTIAPVIPERAVEPERTTRDERPRRAETRTEPPAGAPKVVSSIAFDVLAADAPKPVAGDNNEISWFLGSSSPNPAWSPDGHRIAHYDGRCVTIHDDAGGIVGKLRTKLKNSECRAPRWSGNGKLIVTSHTFHGPGVIFELGSKRSRITGGPGSQLMGSDADGLWSLSFLPDSEHMVGRIHQSGTVLVDAKKRGHTVPLVSDEAQGMQGYFPSFSPRGDHFARVLGEWNGPGELEVARMSLEGAATVKVKDPWDPKDHDGRMGARAFVLRGPILEHAWSSDGARLVAIRATRWYGGYGDFDYGFGELLAIDVPSGDVHVLATGAKNPSWSPDGRFVVFDGVEGDIRLVEVEKPDLGGWTLHRGGIEPQWSPAGHAILTLDPGKQQGVVLLLERP